MDAVMQDQFARVEAALSTLVDSIASYNPSPQAALELVAADDELSSGLDQLSHHQANHTRILALRAEAEALETQLKSSVGTLANLRRELLETPATTFSEDSRAVPSSELLQYAKNISRWTVPPTYREKVPKGDTEAEKDKEDGSSSEMPSNGLSTPVIAKTPPAEGETEERKVTAEQAEWLKELQESGSSWLPWPDYSKIYDGNLMQVQRLLDEKKDPWTTKVPTRQEQLDEQERQKEEENQHKLQVQAPQEPQMPVHRESVVQAPREPQPVFTGFEMDSDEDNNNNDDDD